MQTKSVIKYICQWIEEYASTAKCKGFVIGISGGIDSAVTSTLAAKTNIPLLCVEMPIYQKKNEIKRGKEHINWLKKKYSNVNSIEVNLTPILESYIKQLPNNNNNHELALANTRARLRMTNLYYLAQSSNSLVLGTGNKIEDFGVGFFTKYGDGGVDISPIADLLKSEVYHLAKELNINNKIIQAAPTDGLWENGRTDEEQIGASYSELEWAMSYSGKEKLTKRKEEVLTLYYQLNNANKHKMTPIPVCKIPSKLK